MADSRERADWWHTARLEAAAINAAAQKALVTAKELHPIASREAVLVTDNIDALKAAL